MKHDLTTRAQVVALKNVGHSQHEAAGVIGKPLSFVKRWWNRNDLLDHHAGGKPVKITRSLISEKLEDELRRRQEPLSGWLQDKWASLTRLY